MKHLFIALILLLSNPVHALAWQESPEVGKLFADAGLQGTFVLYDADADRLIGHDRIRAETRFVPVSTFKIPHSLIGLAMGAVKNVDEVLPYGGKPQPFKAWEQDMGLREAIKASNIPVYQELARRIGLQRMRDGLDRLDYGNAEIGAVVDDFWLLGPLKISAVEQTRFLVRLARDELPFPKEIQAAVREIVRLEQGDGWTLYGKTGWADAPNPGLGWWVGWVIKENHPYGFALNIDMTQPSDAAKRIELGKASLKALGVL
ncbi:MAG: class D beta-lactamase [Methylococcaceae bacterium]|nr:class D beta-lactamase [Methylococcaceae bacterium]